jgi:hypothetical protein
MFLLKMANKVNFLYINVFVAVLSGVKCANY